MAFQPKRLSDVFADLILEPLYGVRFRGTAAFDPYEYPRHGRHDRPLLRGGALARDVRHAPRRRRQARLHPGVARGQDRHALDRPVLEQLQYRHRHRHREPSGSRFPRAVLGHHRGLHRPGRRGRVPDQHQPARAGAVRLRAGIQPASNEDPPVRPDPSVRAARAGDPVGAPARPAGRPVHPGPRGRGVRGGVRGLPGGEPRDRPRLGLGRDQAGPAGARRRPRHRGGDPRLLLRRLRHGGARARRPARLRRRRAGHAHARSGPRRGRHHARDARDPRRPPLRAPGRHGAAPGPRGRPRDPPRGRRRPGLRGHARRSPRGRARPGGGLQLLPHEEPRGLRRRRPGDDDRRRRSPRTCAWRGTTARRRSTGTPSSGGPRGWTRCRRPSSG